KAVVASASAAMLNIPIETAALTISFRRRGTLPRPVVCRASKGDDIQAGLVASIEVAEVGEALLDDRRASLGHLPPDALARELGEGRSEIGVRDESVACAVRNAGPGHDVGDPQKRLEQVVSVREQCARCEAQEPLRRALGAAANQASCERLSGPLRGLPPEK